MAKAGRISINVGDPYPCWCQVSHKDLDVFFSIHHNELSDLEYAVKKAKQEVKKKLKEAHSEVDV